MHYAIELCKTKTGVNKTRGRGLSFFKDCCFRVRFKVKVRVRVRISVNPNPNHNPTTASFIKKHIPNPDPRVLLTHNQN